NVVAYRQGWARRMTGYRPLMAHFVEGNEEGMIEPTMSSNDTKLVLVTHDE
ncbi:hypothetical protein EC973_002964, partial [Apophysomyces ossiformis]